MLKVSGLSAGYGAARILFGLDLEARAGEITCVMGRNGAGKTTLMKAVMGLVEVTAGAVEIGGEAVAGLPAHEVPRRRVGYVPQGRRLFGELTVAENIEIGLMVRGGGAAVRDRVLGVFPRLAERLGQRAETLSGGEQQMLATARALCLEPRVLLLDEPTEGLQPSMIEQIRQVALRLRGEGVAVVLVEQRIDAALALADRVVIVENGRNRETMDAAALKASPERLTAHLGV